MPFKPSSISEYINICICILYYSSNLLQKEMRINLLLKYVCTVNMNNGIIII